MVSTPRVELVFFEGCPNAVAARENIEAAFKLLGHSADHVRWAEWDLMSEDTPKEFKRFGSPTVLVDGADVTGPATDGHGMACRADGAPSPRAIAAHLDR